MTRKNFIKLLPKLIGYALACAVGVIAGKTLARPGNPIHCGSWSECLRTVGSAQVLLMVYCPNCPPKPGPI